MDSASAALMPESTRALTTSLRLLPRPIAPAMVCGSETGLFIIVAIVLLLLEILGGYGRSIGEAENEGENEQSIASSLARLGKVFRNATGATAPAAPKPPDRSRGSVHFGAGLIVAVPVGAWVGTAAAIELFYASAAPQINVAVPFGLGSQTSTVMPSACASSTARP